MLDWRDLLNLLPAEWFVTLLALLHRGLHCLGDQGQSKRHTQPDAKDDNHLVEDPLECDFEEIPITPVVVVDFVCKQGHAHSLRAILPLKTDARDGHPLEKLRICQVFSRRPLRGSKCVRSEPLPQFCPPAHNFLFLVLGFIFVLENFVVVAMHLQRQERILEDEEEDEEEIRETQKRMKARSGRKGKEAERRQE